MQAWFKAADNNDKQYIQQHVAVLHHSLDQSGNTALIRAAFSGSIDIIDILSFEQKVQNCIGRTAAMQATFSPYASLIIPKLEEELRMQDNQGQSTLMLLVSQNKIDSVKLLLKEQKLQDKKGRTALMFAASLNHIDIVDILKNYESNIQDQAGLTALMYAAYKNNYNVVRMLAEFESGIQNKKNETALAIAIQKEAQESIQILLKYEQNIKINNVNIQDYANEIINNPEIINQIEQTKVYYDVQNTCTDIVAQNTKFKNQQIEDQMNTIEALQHKLKKDLKIDAFDCYQSNVIQQNQLNSQIQQSRVNNTQQCHQNNTLCDDEINSIKQNMQQLNTQLNKINPQQLNKLQSFNEAMLQQFNQFCQQTNEQVSDFQNKYNVLNLDLINMRNQICQCVQQQNQVDTIENQLKDVIKNNGEVVQLKKNTQTFSQQINNIVKSNEDQNKHFNQSIQQLGENLQFSVNDIENIKQLIQQQQLNINQQLQQPFQQNYQQDQCQKDINVQQQNSFDDVYQQIGVLQNNLMKLLEIQASPQQQHSQEQMFQVIQEVDTLKFTIQKIEAQNLDGRLTSVEQAVNKIFTMFTQQ